MTFPCCKLWESVISSPKDPVNSWNTSYLKYECQEHGTYIEQIGNTWQTFLTATTLRGTYRHMRKKRTHGGEFPWHSDQLYHKETGVMPTSCKVHTARVKFKSRIRYGKLTSAKEASLDTENKLYWNKVHLFGRPGFSYRTTQLKMQSKSLKNHITICLRDWKEMTTLSSSSSQLGI